MKVISVDPGFDRLGVAIMEYQSGTEHLIHSCCIQTNRSDSLLVRLQDMGEQFQGVLNVYKPDTLAIETLFFNQNIKSAIGVAQARGIIIYLAQVAGCTTYEFGPQEVKVAVTGYGKSDKDAVIDMVRRLVPNTPKTALDDEFDAIAVGITCLAHYGRTQ